jgi:hypothetical protein
VNFKELLACREYLLLSEIADVGDSRIRAVICIGGHKRLPREVLGKHIDEIARLPIQYTDASYYELTWERYFSFSVQDEATAPFRREDKFEGNGVRRFTKSCLLDNIASLSNGTHEMRGILMHFGLYTLNHIVDILAYDEPRLRDLGIRGMNSKVPNYRIRRLRLSRLLLVQEARPMLSQQQR